MSNCKKCGKEIEDGDICTECKEKGSKNTVYLLLGVSALVIVVLAACVFYFKVFTNGSQGNTVGNIQNYGYAVEGGNYIFYTIPDKSAQYSNIYKMDKDGKNEKIICEKQWNVYSLNYWKDKLYFIAYEMTDESAEAKIYCMDQDGGNLKLITDEITDSTDRIIIQNDDIYFLNDKYNICKVSVNGGQTTIVDNNSDTKRFIALKDDWMIYMVLLSDKTPLHKKKLNGSQDTVITDETVYDFNIKDNDIYYVTSNVNEDGTSSGQFCKVSLNGGDVKVIKDEEFFNVNISGDYAYYMKSVNTDNAENPYAVSLYKIKLDGSGEQKIADFKRYSSFIDVVGDWVMYSDMDEEAGYMEMIKKDGSEKKQLLAIKYSDMASYQDTGYDVVTDTNTVTETQEMPEDGILDATILEPEVSEE